MTIQEIQQEIIEEFEFFEDWMQRYEHMIEFNEIFTFNRCTI